MRSREVGPPGSHHGAMHKNGTKCNHIHLPQGSLGHHETKISRAKIRVSDAETKAPVPREKKMPKPSAMVKAEKKKRSERFAQPAPCETKKMKQRGGEHAMKNKSKGTKKQKQLMPLTEVKSKAMKKKKKAMQLAKSKAMKKKKRAMLEGDESIE